MVYLIVGVRSAYGLWLLQTLIHDEKRLISIVTALIIEHVIIKGRIAVLHATRLLFEGHPTSGMQPSFMMSSEAFSTSDRTQLIHTFHSTEDDSVLSGVW